MVSTIEKFVTVRKTRGDVLRPEEYRSVVDMIRGVLKNYKFLELVRNHKALKDHIADRNNPHHNPNITYFDEIVESTYAIYVQMTDEPVSLAEFKTDIVPSASFIELVRRIVLNRYLYNQVKRWDGSVLKSNEAVLGNDWDTDASRTSPVLIDFNETIVDENAFRQSNAQGEGNRFVLNAQSLTTARTLLPVIFETSSTVPYMGNPADNSVTLPLVSNDLTVKMLLIDAPTSETTFLSLTNSVDTFVFKMRPDRTVSVLFNDETIIELTNGIDEHEIEFSVNSAGLYTLQTQSYGNPLISVGGVTFRTDVKLTQCVVGTEVESLVNRTFSHRYLTIFSGTLNAFDYVYVIDENGNYVTDDNGDYVIDLDDTFADYSEYLYLLDKNGAYVVDNEGDLVHELAYHYKYKLSNSGAYVRNLEIVISSAYTCMVDGTDNAFLEDLDGSLIVDLY